jgi:hypothetical protein
MALSDNFEVHSLHINVGNGEGAIHLLVDPITEANKRKKNVVYRAILVDGGKKTAVDQILRTIKYIEDEYDIVDPYNDNKPQVDETVKDGKPQLRFDGIVISRWAVDHSAGLLQLINQQLLDDQPDPSTQRKDSNGNPIGACSFLRYKADDKQTPLTNFYSAYWDGPTGASTVGSAPQAVTSRAPPTSQIKLPFPTTFEAGDKTNDRPAVDFIDSNDRGKKWPRVCNLVATPAELIGRELFTGKIQVSSTPDQSRIYDNLSAMLQVNTTEYMTGTGSATGIYCVGADGVTLSAPGQDPTSTDKKTSSIALIAVVGGQVKHYFAGDADFSVGKFPFFLARRGLFPVG